MKATKQEPHWFIPVGTRVVTRVAAHGPDATTALAPGAVGVVVQSPPDGSQEYHVRFPGGIETTLQRKDIRALNRFQQEGFRLAAGAESQEHLFNDVIYRCVVGSRAYGLDEEGSDTDRRGIYLAPADLEWSLSGAPEQIENPETDECYWELRKFLVLALKANPNALECLYSPVVELATPLAGELLGMRDTFLSRLIYQTYNGYVMSEFKRLDKAIRGGRTIKWKHAMHLIRLLMSGVTVLREGFVPLRAGEHRERLLAIRRGDMSWDEVNAWRLDLHKTFDMAFASTRLPELPDHTRANDFLVRARRSRVGT